MARFPSAFVSAMVCVIAPAVHASTFLGSHHHATTQSMATRELDQMLLLEGAWSNGHLRETVEDLRPLFVALPKNEGGRLDPTVVRYALHRHFARQYGWHLRGLEPGGGGFNASASDTIMKDRAPAYILDRFERRMHGHGLRLEELAIFAVALADLIRQEAVSDLEDIFLALGNERSSRMSGRAMASLIKTYLMTYISGMHHARRYAADDFDFMEHTMESDIMIWFDAKMWVQDVRLTYLHQQISRRNPFVSEYTFEDAAEVAQEMGQRFGTFQNMECKSLKQKLVDMEHGGSGRVLLSKFYSGSDLLDWPFIESVDYLRNLGALDETDPKRPSVIIPNFLGSPSNCEAPSSFYSVCCIDECEDLLAEVEEEIGFPTATVFHLVQKISDLPSDTVAAPRNLSDAQVSRLRDIATRHHGHVPLHGRLFAQWMHHAYPRECRFPHAAGSTNPLSREEFSSSFGLHHEVTDEELAKYLEQENATSSHEPAAVALPWSDVEELIAPSRPLDEVADTGSGLMKIIALVPVIASVIFSFSHARTHLVCSDDKQERHFV